MQTPGSSNRVAAVWDASTSFTIAVNLNDGQAHDIANLFISDGSAMSTPGSASPTLTIVALALRQAEYIAQQLGAHSI